MDGFVICLHLILMTSHKGLLGHDTKNGISRHDGLVPSRPLYDLCIC